MSTSVVGAVIDALVTALTTAGINVVDGPAVNAADTGTDTLYIGWDGTEEGSDAASTDQEWAGLGNRARDENLTITCYAEATRGDTTLKPTRDAALAVVAAVETALRSDPQLGGALTGPSHAQFGAIDRLAQPQTPAGSRCGVVFTVTAFARL